MSDVARGRKDMNMQGARRKMRAGVLDSTLSTFFECNAADSFTYGLAVVDHE